jgi:hypothetical protein
VAQQVFFVVKVTKNRFVISSKLYPIFKKI